jgi:hypothetical protein
MSSNDHPSDAMRIGRSRGEITLDYYLIALSILFMLLGFHQWAVILGIMDGPTGPFEDMTTPWKIGTMYLSVVDLVAAVGLWMRVAWGRVVWLLAALSEIVLHTVFVGTFGNDLLILTIHLLTIIAFVALWLIRRR